MVSIETRDIPFGSCGDQSIRAQLDRTKSHELHFSYSFGDALTRQIVIIGFASGISFPDVPLETR